MPFQPFASSSSIAGSPGARRAAPLAFRRVDVDVEMARDRARDLVLHGEALRRLALEAIGPDLQPGRDVDQRRIDAQAAVLQLHAALDHVAHAELVADRRDVDRPARIDARGRARDHAQGRHARQLVGQIVGDAVGQHLLLAAIGRGGERQQHERIDALRGERLHVGTDAGQNAASARHRQPAAAPATAGASLVCTAGEGSTGQHAPRPRARSPGPARRKRRWCVRESRGAGGAARFGCRRPLTAGVVPANRSRRVRQAQRGSRALSCSASISAISAAVSGSGSASSSSRSRPIDRATCARAASRPR